MRSSARPVTAIVVGMWSPLDGERRAT